MPIDVEFGCAITEGERDLGETDRLARVASVENDVGHFAAAERFGGLFAENPAHGIKQIGFSATVRADNGGDALVKIKSRFIGERFEAEKFERL